MSWKKYLISKGYLYSDLNDDYRKGLGWGHSIKIAKIMKGLFEIKKDNKVVFSDFIESEEELKKQVNKVENI